MAMILAGANGSNKCLTLSMVRAPTIQQVSFEGDFFLGRTYIYHQFSEKFFTVMLCIHA